MRWARDEVDLWSESWANQRRKMLGITELQPGDRVGKLNSTLGTIKEMHDGSSQGAVRQTFPEVFTGTALLVNRAWKVMDRNWRPAFEWHYVYLYDARGNRLKTSSKASAIGLSVPAYWKYITFSKNYVHSYVMIFTHLDKAEVMETQNTESFA